MRCQQVKRYLMELLPPYFFRKDVIPFRLPFKFLQRFDSTPFTFYMYATHWFGSA